MDFDESPEEAAFRAEARAWLEQAADTLQARGIREGAPSLDRDWVARAKPWQAHLAENGWAGITWPADSGGRGGTPAQAAIFVEESARAGLPANAFAVGIAMAGPTIIAHGTEAQRRRFLPPMLRGDEVWCQLFSEPGAGSDLAGLSTRAVRDGDEWVVNGQKVWTSGAHYSDLGILLARSDPDRPKHRGITYFLVDMHAPGIMVRPLRQLTGDAEFNEVFFEHVRVPASNILGGVNRGWEVGITTLMYERLALGFGLQARFQIVLDSVLGLARRTRRNGGTAAQDPVLRQKLAQLVIDNAVFKYTGARAITRLLRGERPGPEASAGKIWWCERHQALQETAQELMGLYGQIGKGSPWAVDQGLWQYAFLRSRANSIEGGTTEIQRNIIGERVLGLPKD